MSEELLFEILPTLSPRLRWVKKHGIKTHCNSDMEKPWCAWMKNNERNGLPEDPEMCGYGMLECDALIDLARKDGIKSWKEEG